jgi:hypothetical protein
VKPDLVKITPAINLGSGIASDLGTATWKVLGGTESGPVVTNEKDRKRLGPGVWYWDAKLQQPAKTSGIPALKKGKEAELLSTD